MGDYLSCNSNGKAEQAPLETTPAVKQQAESQLPKNHRSCTVCYVVDCNDPPVVPDAVNLSAPPPPSGHVDLTGKWKLDSIDGDMDKFMQDFGAGYVLRSVASAANYGIGSAVHEIQHKGNDFECKVHSPVKTFTSTFMIGAGQQHIETPEGIQAGTPTWADGGKSVQLKMDKVVAKRSRPSPNEYHVENTLPTGTKIIQKFKTSD